MPKYVKGQAASGVTKSQLPAVQKYKLAAYIESNEVRFKHLGPAAIAAEASATLGFPVTANNVRYAAGMAGVEINVPTPHNSLDYQTIEIDWLKQSIFELANALCTLYGKLGESAPESVTRIREYLDRQS